MKLWVDISDKMYLSIMNEVAAKDIFEVRNDLYELKSAIRKGKTIEPFTDTEQRIFLTAMGREKEICKKEDKWDNRANLVLICGRISRKVRMALWQ